MGSCWIRRYFAAANTQLLYMLCFVFLVSSVLGFSVLPLSAQAASMSGWCGFVFVTLFLIFVQTGIAGIAFPLLCHVGFAADDRAGPHLSLLYVSNILGLAAGDLITDFILMIAFPRTDAWRDRCRGFRRTRFNGRAEWPFRRGRPYGYAN